MDWQVVTLAMMHLTSPTVPVQWSEVKFPTIFMENVVRLSYCQIVLLSAYLIVRLSYCQIVLLSDYLIVRLSYCQIVPLSDYLIVRLSYCQIAVLRHTAFLNSTITKRIVRHPILHVASPTKRCLQLYLSYHVCTKTKRFFDFRTTLLTKHCTTITLTFHPNMSRLNAYTTTSHRDKMTHKQSTFFDPMFKRVPYGHLAAGVIALDGCAKSKDYPTGSLLNPPNQIMCGAFG